MEELEANSLTPKPPLLENYEGDNHGPSMRITKDLYLYLYYEGDNACAKAKQRPELGQPKAPKHVPPRVDELCSVGLGAKITEIVELINKLSHDKLRITEKLDQVMFDRTEIVRALEELNYHERRLRRNMVQIRKEQDIFVLFLGEPHFANNTTHQGKPATKSCLPREELVKHKLHFRVRHGAASLAEEKQLFREIKDAGQHYEDAANSCLLVEEINGSFYREMRCEKTHRKTSKDRLGEIMTWPRKENVAEAIVLGNICNSLSSNRQSVREQLKVLSNELEKLQKKGPRAGPRVGRLKGELKTVEKETSSLMNQLSDIIERKNEARQCLLQLYEKANYLIV